MNFQHKETAKTGMFYLESKEGNDTAAEIVYAKEAPDRIIIQHTEVADELRGQHVGNLLVEAVVEYAREQNMKVIPVCSFASAVFRHKKDYADVLA